jgi:hypothetical protein
MSKTIVDIHQDYMKTLNADEIKLCIKALRKSGLEHVKDLIEKLSDGLDEYAKERKAWDQYRGLAKDQYEDEGTLEIDDNAIVSRCDDGAGAYVQAWVWVQAENLE